jgi:hypothetical protein
MELILAKDLFYDAYLFKNICYYKPKQHKRMTCISMNKRCIKGINEIFVLL